ncbi:hypothetical protein JD522_00450 [Aeromonas hydrophila]|uniref:hypothetical protein n=1 Tax=Aeromonas hydrophila TaxID=644 RepID=UPI00191CFF8C|nr:hypothetical protein [Aeromonas hydrophila]MBL0571910.1 hypothetical protein [Aeromonas hydrophila]
MNDFRYKEPESLILYLRGNDHTPLTKMLKELPIEVNPPVPIFSQGAQYLVEIFNWVSKNPVQVGEICGVLVALINRYSNATLTYRNGDRVVEVNKISAKSAIALAKELREADVRDIYVDLGQRCQVPPNAESDKD